MNQIKIGTFISICRKTKGWTQKQLAERLGITDKAVSKWETGKSMPDLSLLTPLCDLLGITLNELLSGEYISEEDLKEKSDKVLMEIITSWLGQDRWQENYYYHSFVAFHLFFLQLFLFIFSTKEKKTI